MQIYVGITDADWFTHLANQSLLEEVNFWQPSGKRQFKSLVPGELFLFKLHSPNDYIVGGGLFGHHSILPVSLAWAAFEGKNGARTEEEMRARIARYRRAELDRREDYAVGCILLESPFFFEREGWIPIPDWRPQIVQGRSYDSGVEPGKSLFARGQGLLHAKALQGSPFNSPTPVRATPPQRFVRAQFVLPALRHGSFRCI